LIREVGNRLETRPSASPQRSWILLEIDFFTIWAFGWIYWAYRDAKYIGKICSCTFLKGEGMRMELLEGIGPDIITESTPCPENHRRVFPLALVTLSRLAEHV
jgi:hypothetical protein